MKMNVREPMWQSIVHSFTPALHKLGLPRLHYATARNDGSTPPLLPTFPLEKKFISMYYNRLKSEALWQNF